MYLSSWLLLLRLPWQHSCLREEGGILHSNQYVFAQPKSEIWEVVMWWRSMFLSAVQNVQPLRKHVTTISQVLNLKENELDIDLLAQFMGHDRVHREFYRLPLDVLQTAEVAKILWAMENGQLQQLTGKSLDDWFCVFMLSQLMLWLVCTVQHSNKELDIWWGSPW